MQCTNYSHGNSENSCACQLALHNCHNEQNRLMKTNNLMRILSRKDPQPSTDSVSGLDFHYGKMFYSSDRIILSCSHLKWRIFRFGWLWLFKFCRWVSLHCMHRCFSSFPGTTLVLVSSAKQPNGVYFCQRHVQPEICSTLLQRMCFWMRACSMPSIRVDFFFIEKALKNQSAEKV